MTRPIRLQLSRKRGFNLQEVSREANGLEAVNVARPSKFGNPFTAAACREAGYRGTDAEIAERVVSAFQVWVDTQSWWINWQGPESEAARAAILKALPDLRGKNLACWCALPAEGEPDICHAAVLLEIANREPDR